MYSAASPKNGDEFTLIMPCVDVDAFNVYLKEMSRWLGDKKACIVMDQAPWHKAKELELPSNIKILHLPPYTPELNPVERLWQYIKDNTMRNILYESLCELETTVCAFVSTISSDIIKSVCNISYMSHYL